MYSYFQKNIDLIYEISSGDEEKLKLLSCPNCKEKGSMRIIPCNSSENKNFVCQKCGKGFMIILEDKLNFQLDQIIENQKLKDNIEKAEEIIKKLYDKLEASILARDYLEEKFNLDIDDDNINDDCELVIRNNILRGYRLPDDESINVLSTRNCIACGEQISPFNISIYDQKTFVEAITQKCNNCS